MSENNYSQVPKPYSYEGEARGDGPGAILQPEAELNPVHISQHPLVQHKVTLLRMRETSPKDFRQLIREVAELLFYEASYDLPLTVTQIQTPLASTTGRVLAGKSPVLVPILRAGLGMYDRMLDMVPQGDVGFIGMYRDEQSLEPVEYYYKLPKDSAERRIFLIDPMLATGNSVCDAITQMVAHGCDPKNITFICLVAAPDGLTHLRRDHPQVRVVAAALDDGLNENGYIVPGLGDAGDRIFGTK